LSVTKIILRCTVSKISKFCLVYVSLNLTLKNTMINHVTPTITFTSIVFLAHPIFVSHNTTAINNLNIVNRFVFVMFMDVLSAK
jgi:hypothetical protein